MPSPTPQELEEFIDHALASKLRVLRDNKAQRGVKRRTILAILGFIFVPATAIAIWAGGIDGWLPPILVGLFALLYLGLRWFFTGAKLPFEYKSDIVEPLIHFIDPRFKGAPQGSPTPLVAQSQLFSEPLGDVACEDYFRAHLRDLTLHLATIDVDGHQGFFAAAELPRPVQGMHLAQAHFESPADLGTTPVDIATPCPPLRFSTTEAEAGRALLAGGLAQRIYALFQAFEGPQTTVPFALSLMDQRLSIFVGRPGLLHRPRGLKSITDTSHLHALGGQLSRLLDLAESLR